MPLEIFRAQSTRPLIRGLEQRPAVFPADPNIGAVARVDSHEHLLALHDDDALVQRAVEHAIDLDSVARHADRTAFTAREVGHYPRLDVADFSAECLEGFVGIHPSQPLAVRLWRSVVLFDVLRNLADFAVAVRHGQRIGVRPLVHVRRALGRRAADEPRRQPLAFLLQSIQRLGQRCPGVAWLWGRDFDVERLAERASTSVGIALSPTPARSKRGLERQ